MAKDKRSHHKKADTAKAKEKLAVQKEETKRAGDVARPAEGARRQTKVAAGTSCGNVERQVREHSKWSAVKA